jgi:hypothetical protein
MMGQRLKALGLGAAAIIAVSVLAWAATQAGELTGASQTAIASEGGGPAIIGTATPQGGPPSPVSATLTGTQIGAGLKVHKINAGTGKLEPNPVECGTVTFHDVISAAGSEQAFLAPTFGGACKAGGFFATVKPEGCSFRLDNFQKVKADEYKATFGLECAAMKDVSVQMYSAADEKTEECKLTLQSANNVNLESATLRDITTLNPLTDVVATIDAKVEYSQSGKCGVVKSAFATLTGEVTITGDNAAKPTEAVDVEVID